MTSFEVRIERIVAGGDGLGRHEGRVVFVPYTAVGELHLVEPVEEKRDFLRARSLLRLESSDRRRSAPCPYYGRCGGCSLMHLTLDAQRAAKEAILLECLERGSGGTRIDAPPVRVHASPENSYRTRLRFHLGDGKAADRAMGFRRRRRHDVESVEQCLLGTEALNDAWRRCRRAFAERGELARAFESVEIQESTTNEGRVIARFVVRSRHGRERRGRRFPPALGREILQATGVDGLLIETERGATLRRVGQPSVEHQAGEVRFRQSAGSFYQTNRHLLDALVDAARPDETVPRVVDLYCGVGFLALPLASQADEVVGVETSASALRDARFNARRAGIEHVHFHREDAGAFAARWAFEERDYVVVDPPRAGLSGETREALAASPVRTLCYLSCDPAAFARDVGYFVGKSFRLETLDLFDFFPNTHHFETVARLSRR